MRANERPCYMKERKNLLLYLPNGFILVYSVHCDAIIVDGIELRCLLKINKILKRISTFSAQTYIYNYIQAEIEDGNVFRVVVDGVDR